MLYTSEGLKHTLYSTPLRNLFQISEWRKQVCLIQVYRLSSPISVKISALLKVRCTPHSSTTAGSQQARNPSSDYSVASIVWKLGKRRTIALQPRALSPGQAPGKFNALSYAWGSSVAPKTIWLDNAIFQVRENLYRALHSFHDESRSIIFWIDAICINQKDDLEKAHQLQQIKRAYEVGGLVVVWL